MDPCFWRLYEPAADGNEPRLCGLLCLHVDDMLGGGDPNSATYQAAEQEIQKAFNFRSWQKDEDFEYCGSQMTRDEDGTWHVSHSEYFKKVLPIPVDKNRPPGQPLTDKEQTMLRGLLGSLQWPAVQTSPHIQASTPLLSGEMSNGTSSALLEANRLLRFCKTNSDVHLTFPPLGQLEDLRISCMFDAALGVRHDGSSQGGYIVLLTHKDTFEGKECPYHVLDWRSFRLPRIARSSLAAEAQSAAQAVDSTEFVIRFWHMTLHPNATLKETLAIDRPSLAPIFVTDAKALYDSFHRHAINHGATDKRTSLELRVIREQVEGIGGTLKWISSERQFGDGFTKMQARQLLADRIRHGSIKYTWDPTYQAAKKKTAAEREKSRNEFSTQLHNTTNTTTSEPQPTSLEHNAVKVGATPQDLDNHEAEMNDAPVETYETEAFDTTEHDATLNTNEASEYDQHSPNEYQTDETFESANVQSPVEAYSSHGGGSGVIKYVFFAIMLQNARAAVTGLNDVCSIDDAPLETNDADDLLHFLVWSVSVLCMVGLYFFWTSRKLKAEVLSLRDEYAQCRENFRDQVKTLDSENWRLKADKLDLQLTVDRADEIRFQQRADDRREIWTAMGLLDRALSETMNFRSDAAFATTRRCWHLRANCPGLINANQVFTREPCVRCLADAIPPLMFHEHTGTTLQQDCQTFFSRHGGRPAYMDTLVHDGPNAV